MAAQARQNLARRFARAVSLPSHSTFARIAVAWFLIGVALIAAYYWGYWVVPEPNRLALEAIEWGYDAAMWPTAGLLDRATGAWVRSGHCLPWADDSLLYDASWLKANVSAVAVVAANGILWAGLLTVVLPGIRRVRHWVTRHRPPPPPPAADSAPSL